MSATPNPLITQLANEIGGEINEKGILCFGLPERPIFIHALDNGYFALGSQHPLYDTSRGKVERVNPGEGDDFGWYWLHVSPKNVRRTLDVALDPPDSVEDEMEFRYESMLRDHCALNLSAIEEGLKVYEHNGVRGVEFPAGGRFIDILAVDSTGVPVIIEFKLSLAEDGVIAQLLYYMGWISRNPPSGVSIRQRVRGIIVARQISESLRVAVNSHPDIQLMEFALSFTVKLAN